MPTRPKNLRPDSGPGLYLRNGRYYAQLWIDKGDGTKTARKMPLLLDDADKPITTLVAAREALEVKRHQRREHNLPTPGFKPTLAAYTETYFAKATVALKRPSTIASKQQAISRWKAHMGGLRLDKITLPNLVAFVDKRLDRRGDGVSKRTVALDLIALRNVLKASIEDGMLDQLPRFPKVKPEQPKKRPLLTPKEFEALLGACAAIKPDGTPLTKNGAQLRDYLEFLAYSGSREKEALRIRWSDVDLNGRRVTIGSDGMSKNHMSRTVEFNPKLNDLLLENRWGWHHAHPA